MKRYDISKLEVLKPNAYKYAQINGIEALRYLIDGMAHPFYDMQYITSRASWSQAMLSIYILHCVEDHIASMFYTKTAGVDVYCFLTPHGEVCTFENFKERYFTKD